MAILMKTSASAPFKGQPSGKESLAWCRPATSGGEFIDCSTAPLTWPRRRRQALIAKLTTTTNHAISKKAPTRLWPIQNSSPHSGGQVTVASALWALTNGRGVQMCPCGIAMIIPLNLPAGRLGRGRLDPHNSSLSSIGVCFSGLA